MFTNIGLVEHAKKALREKWVYTYSTFGQILNEQILQWAQKTYPNNINKYIDYIRKNNLRKRSADCVGLTKSYLWWNDGNIKYNALQDLSANGMFNAAKEKGVISAIPEILGLGVWRNGHVGVYLTNNIVIEMKGTMYGCVQTPLTGKGSNNWSHWFKYPFIEYIEEKEDDILNMKSLVCKKIVNTIALNIREKPNSTSKILGTLKQGDVVQVTGDAENKWLRIDFGGKDAFVHSAYLKDILEIDYQELYNKSNAEVKELKNKIIKAKEALN